MLLEELFVMVIALLEYLDLYAYLCTYLTFLQKVQVYLLVYAPASRINLREENDQI